MAQPKPRPSSLVKQNLMAPESINEKLEQPSPVSVLEKFISDDISSPDSTGTENCMIWQFKSINSLVETDLFALWHTPEFDPFLQIIFKYNTNKLFMKVTILEEL